MKHLVQPFLRVMERTAEEAAAREVQFPSPTIHPVEAMRRLHKRYDHYLLEGCAIRYNTGDRTMFVAEKDGVFFASVAIIAEGNS